MNWHLLFGSVLEDLFSGTPFEVNVEVVLSQKQQFLDIAVIRKHEGEVPWELPDGMDNFAHENLITFKSYQDILDVWAIKELIGHYVNYRKHFSPSLDNLHPEDRYRLYAVCARFPQQLHSDVGLTTIIEGVYGCQVLNDTIRILVANQLPLVTRNAIVHLFSSQTERVEYGRSHYQAHSEDSNSIIQKMLDGFTAGEISMPLTIDDFLQLTLERLTPKQVAQLKPRHLAKILSQLTTEQLSQLTAEQLSHLTAEQLSHLTAEQLSHLTAEQLSHLTAEQLSHLTAEQLSQLTAEQLSHLTAEQLSQLTAEQLSQLTAEQLSQVPIERRLAGLTTEQIRHYLESLESSSEDADNPPTE